MARIDYQYHEAAKLAAQGIANAENKTALAIRTTQTVADGTEVEYKNGVAKSHICDSIVPTRCAAVTPNRTLEVSTQVRLVGTAFDGTAIDAQFWTATVTNDGTVTQGGEAILKTNTTANGTAKLVSKRKARFVVGAPMQHRAVVEWHTAGDENNLRRIGAYDTNNGFFFQLDGEVFSIGSRTNSSGSPVDTLVSSGSFNGDVTTYDPSTTRHKCNIEYTGTAVFFMIDGVLIHKLNLDHDNSPVTFTYPITIENINDADNATSVDFHITGTAIYRLGQLTTNPQYYYFAAGTGSAQLKIGAGAIHTIIFNNVVNNAVITISDSTTTTTPTILAHTAGETKTTVTSIDMRGAPFNDGLRLTVATQNASLTIVYE